MQKSLKARLQEGERLIGSFVMMPSGDVAEILCLAGFDFLLLDHEHGTGGIVDLVGQLRAMDACGVPSMVRVPFNDPAYVKRVLDAGAQNILCPNVESAEDAKKFVDACLYPPRGIRGAGGGVRAARYGFDMPYYQPESEDRMVIAVQIESERGVNEIENIALVPGVDMLFIGPRDLSSSIGVINKFDDAGLLALMSRAEETIKSTGKLLGSVIYPGKTSSEMFERGYNMLIAGTDVGFLAAGARQALKGR